MYPQYPSHFYVRLKIYNPKQRCVRKRHHIGHPKINQLFKGGDGIKEIPLWYKVNLEQAQILSQYKQDEADPFSPMLFDIVDEQTYGQIARQEAVARQHLLGVASPEQATQQAVAAMQAASHQAMQQAQQAASMQPQFAMPGMPGGPNPFASPFGAVSGLPLPNQQRMAAQQPAGPQDISSRAQPEPDGDTVSAKVEQMTAHEPKIEEMPAPDTTVPAAAPAQPAQAQPKQVAKSSAPQDSSIAPEKAGRAAALEGLEEVSAVEHIEAPIEPATPQPAQRAMAPEDSSPSEEAEVYSGGESIGSYVASEQRSSSDDDGYEMLASLIDTGTKEDLLQLANKMGVKADRRNKKETIQRALRESAGLEG